MSEPRSSESPRERGSAWGTVAQVVGAIGFLLGVALAVAVLVVRGRVVDRVDAIASRLDDRIAQAAPLLVRARERADGASSVVASMGEALRTRAATEEPPPEWLQSMLERAKELSERYLALRATYADAREKALSVVDRLNAIDAVTPAISVPQGPAEVLAALDERARALDANVMALIDALPEVGSGVVSDAILEKVDASGAALQGVSARLDEVEKRLDELRRRIDDRVGRIRALLTWVAVGLALLFLYGAFLHAVLFRSGRNRRVMSDR